MTAPASTNATASVRKWGATSLETTETQARCNVSRSWAGGNPHSDTKAAADGPGVGSSVHALLRPFAPRASRGRGRNLDGLTQRRRLDPPQSPVAPGEQRE